MNKLGWTNKTAHDEIREHFRYVLHGEESTPYDVLQAIESLEDSYDADREELTEWAYDYVARHFARRWPGGWRDTVRLGMHEVVKALGSRLRQDDEWIYIDDESLPFKTVGDAEMHKRMAALGFVWDPRMLQWKAPADKAKRRATGEAYKRSPGLI